MSTVFRICVCISTVNTTRTNQYFMQTGKILQRFAEKKCKLKFPNKRAAFLDGTP